jgi:hypothetical protein
VVVGIGFAGILWNLPVAVIAWGGGAVLAAEAAGTPVSPYAPTMLAFLQARVEASRHLRLRVLRQLALSSDEEDGRLDRTGDELELSYARCSVGATFSLALDADPLPVSRNEIILIDTVSIRPIAAGGEKARLRNLD